MNQVERTVMFQLPSVLAGALACVEGTVKGRSFELNAGTFVIGRMDTMDLQLPNEPGVSKTHAKIIAEGDHYVIVDCESRNGTIVNGSPVQRAALHDGDEIRVCGCVLRFSQRGAPSGGVRVKNIDAAPVAASAAHDVTDPADGPAPNAAQLSDDRAHDSDVASNSAPRPSLWLWYGGGLAATLLLGTAASAYIIGTAPVQAAAEVVAARASTDAGVLAAPSLAAPPPSSPEAVAVAEAGLKDARGKDPAQHVDTDSAAVKVAVAEPAATGKTTTAAEPAPVNDTAATRRDTPRRKRTSSSAASADDDGAAATDSSAAQDSAPQASDGASFAAVPDQARTESVKAKAGKVKSVDANEGDVVSKGQSLVTFEDGASQDEIVSLRDRIASLEAVDSEDARRELKASRQKLDALVGARSGPIVAPASGTLAGWSVAAGQVLKAGDTLGRVSDGDTPKRVRVTVAKSTKARRGQSVTLVLKRGGEGDGVVGSVNGRNVVVDCGDLAAEEVSAVRF